MAPLKVDYVSVGTVASALGLKGEIKVYPLTDNPDRYASIAGQTVLWRKDTKQQVIKINSVRASGKFFVLGVEGISDRKAAEALIKGELTVSRADLPRLQEGKYYIFELIDLEVYTVQGELLGQIMQVLQPGSNDVYVILGPKGEILLPALKSVVKEVALAQRRMVVELPAGLLDIDED
ncbi:MAG: ribosome maturation factor RimM [bacterium]|nr:ribosome maturation factor RimM [bacterium]